MPETIEMKQIVEMSTKAGAGHQSGSEAGGSYSRCIYCCDTTEDRR